MTNQFVFFPFTHITKHQLKTLLAFVEPFHYFSAEPEPRVDFSLKPLNLLADEKKVIAHFVPENLADRVAQNQAQYLDWVKIHKGNEHNLKALLKDRPYFNDDTQVASIKSKLRNATQVASIKSQLRDETQAASIKSRVAAGIEDNTKRGDDEKNLEQHLLFLKMAHLCDKQNENIDIELDKLDVTKGQLLSTLRGLNEPGESDEEKKGSDSGGKVDHGAVMTRERIESWAVCMSKLNGYSTKNPPVFVTTSQAVFDYLESICEDCLNALDIDEIKVHENDCENKKEWLHCFDENLKGAVQRDVVLEDRLPKVDDTCSLVGQVKVNLFSGNEINRCFNLSDKQVMVCLIKLK